MAIYYELKSKETGETVGPSKADDLMRKHFGEEPDSVRYYRNWHDTIGFYFAAGKTVEEIKEAWDDKLDIINYLVETYNIENGFCRKGY